VPGWNPQARVPIQQSIEAQSDRAENDLNTKLYEIIGKLSDNGFSADMYWRVQNFRGNIGVVPVSAMTGEGIPDLLTVLMGLSQRYLKEDMSVDVTGPGAGTVLEVKEERGFGTTVDLVLYDGTIRADDTIVVGGTNDPIVTDVRALLQPRPLAEIRTEKEFEKVNEVGAAAGIKVAAPDLDDAMAGAPVRVVRDQAVAEVVEAVEAELSQIDVETTDNGVVVKADTLGSLEAIANALEEAEVPIVRAEVGDVAPRDIAVASTADEPIHEVVLAFNVDVLADARRQATEQNVRIFDDDVIYQLVEEYEAFVTGIEESQQEQVLDKIARPCRFQILADHTFRQSNPAVVGVEVLAGTLKRNSRVVKWTNGEATRVGQLKSLQDEGEDVDQARAGDRVAASIDGPTVGRQIEEGDELWTELPEKHAKILEQEVREELPTDEREALSMYLEKQRKRDPFWGK
jgi:translation initiation factor 5B